MLPRSCFFICLHGYKYININTSVTSYLDRALAVSNIFQTIKNILFDTGIQRKLESPSETFPMPQAGGKHLTASASYPVGLGLAVGRLMQQHLFPGSIRGFRICSQAAWCSYMWSIE